MQINYKPSWPKNSPYRIGLIGAGEIVKFCHLPAYQKAGFQVTAICDVDESKARELAELFNIRKVYSNAESLCRSEDVDIVDIATPTQVMFDLVSLACRFKKHVLCQKPLALSLSEAIQMADMIAQADVKGAVNHQMRYSPSINAARDLIRKNKIGEIAYAEIRVNVNQPWERWSFWHDTEFFTLYGHTIHYMDSLRYLFNKNPVYVYTQMAKVTNRPNVPEGLLRDYSIIDFGDDVKAQIDVSHNNQYHTDDWFAGFRIEGTQGVINGKNGALYNYPVGTDDSLAWYDVREKVTHTPLLEGRWFPDAFSGTMGELMLAIQDGREPTNSVKDGIDTIRFLEASVRSVKENRPVYLQEIEG